MREGLRIGQIVRSAAGRDKGNFMIIVAGPCGGYVLLADGKRRKSASPKKKKIKHICPTNYIAEDIALLYESGKTAEDATLRKALESYVK